MKAPCTSTSAVTVSLIFMVNNVGNPTVQVINSAGIGGRERGSLDRDSSPYHHSQD